MSWSESLLEWLSWNGVLTRDEFDRTVALAELVAGGFVSSCTAKAHIALLCAQLLTTDPDPDMTPGRRHLQGTLRSGERQDAAWRQASQGMNDLLVLALPLARAECKAAEERAHKAAAGRFLDGKSVAVARKAASEAANFMLSPVRLETVVIEEAAWWIRHRAPVE